MNCAYVVHEKSSVFFLFSEEVICSIENTHGYMKNACEHSSQAHTQTHLYQQQLRQQINHTPTTTMHVCAHSHDEHR